MSTDVLDPEVKEIAPTLPMTAGGTVDVQVSTAKKFPRSITAFIRRATEMATLTPEIAASCVYALPRGGKTIEGPSARLAEIVASAYGNLRVQAGATDNDDHFITARGEAWDVESNVAIGFEVKRRITNKRGETFDDDMITVTGNAAASIALRNAVFKAVPSSFWRPIYQKCRQVVAGDAKTFGARRDEMLKAFMVAGVTHEQLCAGIGLKGIADITLDHMVTLTGILNAIKDGETTIEEAFDKVSTGPQPAQRKSQQQHGGGTSPTPASDSAPAAAPSRSHAPVAPHIGRIVEVKDRQSASGKTFFSVKNARGFSCTTWSTSVAQAARDAQEAGVSVELVCKAPNDPKYPPTLEKVIEGVEA